MRRVLNVLMRYRFTPPTASTSPSSTAPSASKGGPSRDALPSRISATFACTWLRARSTHSSCAPEIAFALVAITRLLLHSAFLHLRPALRDRHLLRHDRVVAVLAHPHVVR